MKLGFEESPQSSYDSGSQKARVLTEAWARKEGFLRKLRACSTSGFRNNSPVADFYCGQCDEEYELKSQKRQFGAKILDGAYRTMCERLIAQNNPNLMLLNYTLTVGVNNLFVVPKHFFVSEIIQERKPLKDTARRAGWVGCNILLSQVPEVGKIYIVRDGVVAERQSVLDQWQKTIFLRDENLAARGWLINVLRCVEAIGAKEFNLDQVYAFESRLSGLYPMNRHVRQKIRQQLQVLRDRGLLMFLGRGRYRLI